MDALLLGPPIRSYPELSLSPVFRRQWPGAYMAIEEGQQDPQWLEGHFSAQIPAEGVQVFSLDGTVWPHPEAKTLADRQLVYCGGKIVVGHPYSVLAWVPEPDRSWAPPVSVRRVSSQQTDTEMGVAQVKRLCRLRHEEMLQWLHLIVGDWQSQGTAPPYQDGR